MARRYRRQDPDEDEEEYYIERRGGAFGAGFFGCFGVLAAVVLIGIVVFVACAVVASRVANDVVDTVSTAVADVDLSVRVGGTPGLAFAGSCLVTSRNGSSGTESVQGQVPVSRTYHGSLLSCTFQKAAVDGTLSAAIVDSRGGILKESSTEAAYGLVSVATIP